MVSFDEIIERTGTHVATHPRRVVITFLVITLIMGVGLGNVSTETGTEQFSEGTPAEKAFEKVNEEFGVVFGADTGSSQLIQVHTNVLSKPSLRRMLRAQKRLENRPRLRVTDSRSAAQQVARQLDPNAETLEGQIDAVESASSSEIDNAVRRAASGPGFRAIVSDDFNPESASAGATIGVVTHQVPAGLSTGAGMGGESPLQSIQVETEHVVDSVGGDIRVFGTGIISEEFANVIVDSLILVIPAAVLLIIAFLIYAYRDPFDLLIAAIALAMTLVWTFGFMGLAGIPFTQMLTAVPPLLLAVGIDFGIHSVNRYREERIDGSSIVDSMQIMMNQLLVAFFIVTVTTMIGFGSNVTSSLPPVRDFGIVAAIGIVFTFFIFGIFMPALKLEVDRWREKRAIPPFGTSPIGREGTPIGESLQVGVVIARRGPRVFLALLLIVGVASAGYGAGIDTSFSEEDFLPPEQTPDYLDRLPEPFRPAEYTVTRDINYLEEHFSTATRDSVTIYVSDSMRADHALESIDHAERNPPESFVRDGRRAQSSSIIGVIDSYANDNPEFRALIERNDANDNGIPDDNLEAIYDELMASPYETQAKQYLTEEYRSAKVVYDVKSSASQREVVADGQYMADQYRLNAVATGQIVVFQSISDTIFDSAIKSLTTALVLSAVFLVVIYRLLEGGGTLGVVNLVPIALSLSLIVGTMRYLGIPFNALTATVLAISIGLGVDYSAHMTHRFVDEYNGDNLGFALQETVIGTGGALTGSMATTASGIGVLVIAITPILGQFGTVTALAIVYSYLTAILVLPSAIVAWHDLGGYDLP